MRCRLTRLFVLACLPAFFGAPPALAQVAFQQDLALAQKQAKLTGLPLLVLVVNKGDKVPAPLLDPKAAGPARAFLTVVLPANGTAAKTLDAGPAGSLLLLDGEGNSLASVTPGFAVEELVAALETVQDRVRGELLERLPDTRPAARQKLVFDSIVRLGATLPELISLLKIENPAIGSAIKASLASRRAEGADWLLLNGMASADAEVRAACYPLALAVNRAPKVPALKFWQEASEEERATAWQQWHAAVYGELPRVNKEVLDFVYANFGKKVNRGECAELAAAALAAAGGKEMTREGGTYVWGRALQPKDQPLPGDIVQMQNALLQSGKTTTYTPDGGHTQIVRRVLGPGRYEILEQNVDGRRTVGLALLDLATLKQGKITIYRPLEPDDK